MRSDTRSALDGAGPGDRTGLLPSVAGAVPSRTVVVLDAIKHAILAGHLRPGQGLVETDLAGMLGVSKTPVREALKTLAGAGLVTMSPYKGAAVRIVDGDLVRSVYDLRLLLEPEAVRRAVACGGHGEGAPPGHREEAPPGNPGTLPGGGWEAAREALRRAERATDRAERSVANRDFHRALYLGCGNALLVRVLDDLRDQTALVSAAAWQRAPTWRAEAAEHDAILRAATAGDGNTASTLLKAHIENFLSRNFPSLTDTADTAEAADIADTGDPNAP